MLLLTCGVTPFYYRKERKSIKEVTIYNGSSNEKMCIFRFHQGITRRTYKMIVDMMFSLAADNCKNSHLYCQGIDLEMITIAIDDTITANLYHYGVLTRTMCINNELVRRWLND